MEADFHRWLEFAGESAGVLLLNGDLFDFWFEWGSTIPPGHDRVLTILREIVASGVPVHLVGGNHDWWGGRYLTDEIGVTFYQHPTEMVLGGKKALVAHGDGLGDGDFAYRMMRSVLRSRLASWGFGALPARLGLAIAGRVSRTGGRTSGPEVIHTERSRLLENWAARRLQTDSTLDLVLLGHTHLPRRVEVTPGRFYLNSGDWLRHGSYLIIGEDVPLR